MPPLPCPHFQVSFGLELDVYDFCSPELRAQLDGPRAALKAHQDHLLQQKKVAAGKVMSGGGRGLMSARAGAVRRHR